MLLIMTINKLKTNINKYDTDNNNDNNTFIIMLKNILVRIGYIFYNNDLIFYYLANSTFTFNYNIHLKCYHHHYLFPLYLYPLPFKKVIITSRTTLSLKQQKTPTSTTALTQLLPLTPVLPLSVQPLPLSLDD